jgi:hypothetical protein
MMTPAVGDEFGCLDDDECALLGFLPVMLEGEFDLEVSGRR